MEARCKVCGKPLRDPISIARGMGPKCAGVTSSGRSYCSSQRQHGGSAYLFNTPARTTSLFSFVEEPTKGVPDTLRKFPSDLVDLVLSAPTAGSIASRIKLYSRRRKDTGGVDPAKVLRQIRRICIEFRLLFWPGISSNSEPLPCIPYGENDWKIGQDGKVCSKDELVAYLSRYGIISSQVVE